MPTPPLSPELAQQALDLVTIFGSGHLASRHTKPRIAPRTIDHRAEIARERGMEPSPEAVARAAPTPGETQIVDDDGRVTEAMKLRDEVKRLRSALNKAGQKDITYDAVREWVTQFASTASSAPDWQAKTRVGKKTTGVPTIFASDWHLGEVVNPKEVLNVNSFDMEIAKRRARNLIERAVTLLFGHLKDPHYPYVVFALGGDMVSGDIHEELSNTNDEPIMAVVCEAVDILEWCVRELLKHFPRVYVPCVTGNHGRNTRKPQYKERGPTNFDWLIYKQLAARFSGDKRVGFEIPDGPDLYYSIFNHRYCLTHGDQYRGGSGIAGPLMTIVRGRHKKVTRDSAIGNQWDTIIMGHWHSLMQLPGLVVNGTLKGFDEYAWGNNFPFEAPSQACWITHPDHGVTFQMPIYVGETAK